MDAPKPVPQETAPAASPPPPKPKILIIDDESHLGMMLQDILEAFDFTTAFAETAEAALKSMIEFKPTIALIDFRLGEVNGLELAQKLKAIDEDLPCILMTAYPSLDLAVKAIQHDIYDFIAKPVDKTYLLRCISKAAEKRNLIEENKRLIQHLKQTNAKLEKMDRMKSKFLSIVTHDLRTPLTSIRGFAEMLQTENLTPEDKERCFGAIERSTERMGYLISNLMDMISIEAGKLRVEKSRVDFLAIAGELKETMASVAAAKKVNLEWKLCPGPLAVLADSNRIIQVLTNLISNGFKHVPENGRIVVQVSRKEPDIAAGVPPCVLVEVIDNGEGIAPEDQERIFEQFYQVESSATKREGLGLGLNISQEIVRAHQGTLGVRSEGLGKGCTFFFTLPLLPPES